MATSPSALLVGYARSGNVARMAAQIAAGANVNAGVGRGDTPLTAAAYSGSAEAVALLLGAGAHVDGVNGSGATALCTAALHDKVAVIGALLGAGAVVNRVCGGDFTALHRASQCGKVDSVRALLQAGADMMVRSPATRQRAIDVVRAHWGGAGWSWGWGGGGRGRDGSGHVAGRCAWAGVLSTLRAVTPRSCARRLAPALSATPSVSRRCAPPRGAGVQLDDEQGGQGGDRDNAGWHKLDVAASARRRRRLLHGLVVVVTPIGRAREEGREGGGGEGVSPSLACTRSQVRLRVANAISTGRAHATSLDGRLQQTRSVGLGWK
jgi:uncharacterized protein